MEVSESLLSAYVTLPFYQKLGDITCQVQTIFMQ
ncbi:MAG: hypothetical protein ACJASL_000740 [Paraglaciecola sp.]|jgi:hypothetical protein